MHITESGFYGVIDMTNAFSNIGFKVNSAVGSDKLDESKIDLIIKEHAVVHIIGILCAKVVKL